MSTYLKNMAGYKHTQLKNKSFEEIQMLFEKEMKRVNIFVDMDAKLVKGSKTIESEVDKVVPELAAGSSKRDAKEELDQESSKRQKTGESSKLAEEPRIKEADELSQEELQQMMIMVPEQGMNVEALQTKYPIINWEICTEGTRKDDLVMLWSLVKEKFNSTEPTDDKERDIWVELYDSCGVHHVSTENGIDIYMLVEKVYPLSRGTLTLMLVAKLLADQDNEMFRELFRKIFMQRKITSLGEDCWELKVFILSTAQVTTASTNQLILLETVNVEETSSKGMVAIDGSGFDWSYMADNEVPTNMALMGFFQTSRVIYLQNLNLSYSGLEEFQQPEFEGYGPKTSKSVSENISNEVRSQSLRSHPKKKIQGYVDSGCSAHDREHVLSLRLPDTHTHNYRLREEPKEGKLLVKELLKLATLDESMLWHRRLGHVNFKTINKLVKENLVRGLPTKRFENDQTCVACLKGKQHKASFVTDDYSRFTWVFFLATKDETSGILKSFLTTIENLVDKKVKIIRCDNGTEFKNRVMGEFCEKKGIKKEFSVARTPQQNGVVERRN
ncbi:putative reverse transcriptase domain-containing protein [Tanacetum coccineum]